MQFELKPQHEVIRMQIQWMAIADKMSAMNSIQNEFWYNGNLKDYN